MSLLVSSFTSWLGSSLMFSLFFDEINEVFKILEIIFLSWSWRSWWLWWTRSSFILFLRLFLIFSFVFPLWSLLTFAFMPLLISSFTSWLGSSMMFSLFFDEINEVFKILEIILLGWSWRSWRLWWTRSSFILFLRLFLIFPLWSLL